MSDEREEIRPAGAAPTDGTGPMLLRLRRPEEVLAAVPYLLGEEPAGRLVALGLRAARIGEPARVVGALCSGLPAPAAEAATVGYRLVADVRGWADHLVLIGYGQVPPTLLPGVVAAAAHHRVRLIDLLQVHEGRWWSLCCPDPVCCPPAGRRLPSPDAAQTAWVTETCRAAGLTVRPSGRSSGQPPRRRRR
jgi:hypothetical protein